MSSWWNCRWARRPAMFQCRRLRHRARQWPKIPKIQQAHQEVPHRHQHHDRWHHLALLCAQLGPRTCDKKLHSHPICQISEWFQVHRSWGWHWGWLGGGCVEHWHRKWKLFWCSFFGCNWHGSIHDGHVAGVVLDFALLNCSPVFSDYVLVEFVKK